MQNMSVPIFNFHGLSLFLKLRRVKQQKKGSDRSRVPLLPRGSPFSEDRQGLEY
jgi:hypothetical protein